MIKRFAQCLREYKWTALVSPVCMIGEVAMEVTIPLVMADLYDYGIAMSNMTVVWQKALQLLLCALASLLFGCLSADYASKAATGFARNVRHDMYYRVQDFSAAEDLTQDVFVKLTRHIHSYVPTASFSAFLYRIAHNTVVDYYRTTKHTETIPETLQAADPLPAAEARMDVERMLAKLSEEQRECIILYYLQGLTYREISLVLGIPVPTAKSRVQRGLAACKKIMEEKS